MSITVYNVVPMVLHRAGQVQQFLLRLNPSTESFRLESGALRRSIFISKRVSNRLVQKISNEYGFSLGRIHYNNDQMRMGSATTEEHDQYKFTIRETNDIEVEFENEADPSHKMMASIPLKYSSDTEKAAQINALVPSVLAALIFSKELTTVL